MGSKQANEINNNNKESKAESTGNDKRRARSIFLCDVEEEGFKEAKESTERKNEERVISIPETAKRGASNRNNASEPEKSTTFLMSSSGRFISQRATKSEPRGSAVILDPALTFYP